MKTPISNELPSSLISLANRVEPSKTAMVAGEQNPEILVELAHRRLKGKREQLVEALQGTLSEHYRFLLASQLKQMDFFDQQLQELDQEIVHRMGLSSDAPDALLHLPPKEEAQESPPPGPPNLLRATRRFPCNQRHLKY